MGHISVPLLLELSAADELTTTMSDEDGASALDADDGASVELLGSITEEAAAVLDGATISDDGVTALLDLTEEDDGNADEDVARLDEDAPCTRPASRTKGRAPPSSLVRVSPPGHANRTTQERTAPRCRTPHIMAAVCHPRRADGQHHVASVRRGLPANGVKTCQVIAAHGVDERG